MIVTFDGDEARARSPEGKEAALPLAYLLSLMAPHRLSTEGCILPDGVKCLIPLPGGRLVVVHETPPLVFNLRWVAKRSPRKAGGPGTKYRDVRVALPYVVVLAVYHQPTGGPLRLSGANECFFRNAPLKSLDDELCYPALLNCSRFDPQEGHPLAWICTQYLQIDQTVNGGSPGPYLERSLTALLQHLFQSGFNYSSDENEYSSWFSEHVKASVDPRIGSIEAWEEATRENPMFVLEIPWLKTGMSLGQVATRIAEMESGPCARVSTSADLGRMVFRGERLRKKLAMRKKNGGNESDAPGQTTLYTD